MSLNCSIKHTVSFLVPVLSLVSLPENTCTLVWRPVGDMKARCAPPWTVSVDRLKCRCAGSVKAQVLAPFSSRELYLFHTTRETFVKMYLVIQQ